MKSSSTPVADMLTRFDDSKRAVANLMARENITCQVVDGAETAKFNPTTRILIVPNWTGLTVEQCDLLMSHEIGHALFTDRKLNLKGVTKGLFSYYNIIEDARIERRMKGAFPGLAPTFYKGYREFHTNGPLLKGTKDSLYNPKDGKLVPFAKMRLIDRINMHYKIGAFCAVPFNAKEAAILARIDKSTSSDECLAIAKELYREDKNAQNQDKQKSDPQPKQKPQPKQEETEESDSNDSDDQDATDGDSQDDQDENESDSKDADGDKAKDEETDDLNEAEKDAKADESDDQDGDEDESDDSSSDSDDSDGDEDGDESDSKDADESDDQDGDEAGESDADPSAETDLNEALQDIANKVDPNAPRQTLKNLVYPVLSDEAMKGRIVTAHEFTTKGLEALTANGATAAELDAAESKWNAKYLATAKHMALEFERRKSARNLQNAITGRSGKLDMTKLAGYRFTEDLFKRTITVPNGKSHGIVMMIDGSGSMSSCFAEVIDQVLLFAHFAFIVNIPFEAYMFSDSHEYRSYDDTRSGKLEGEFDVVSQGINALTLSETGRLIGLVNTTTNRAEFKKNCQVLLAVRSTYSREYSVTGSSAIPNSSLSGTPLFQGIMIAERIVARMKTQQKLDKTTFVVITDGEDTNGIEYEAPGAAQPSYYGRRRTINMESLNSAFVIRDAVTKKNLSFVDIRKGYNGIEMPNMPENAVLTMMLDIMKLRHDTRTVYIYLQEGSSYRSSYRRRRYTRPSYSVQGFDYLVRAGKTEEASKIDKTAVATSMKEDGQYVLPATVSVADLSIILPVGSVRLTEDEFSKMDTDDMTQKKIAAEFTKSMVKAVSNRKFVNSVVPHLI